MRDPSRPRRGTVRNRCAEQRRNRRRVTTWATDPCNTAAVGNHCQSYIGLLADGFTTPPENGIIELLDSSGNYSCVAFRTRSTSYQRWRRAKQETLGTRGYVGSRSEPGISRMPNGSNHHRDTTDCRRYAPGDGKQRTSETDSEGDGSDSPPIESGTAIRAWPYVARQPWRQNRADPCGVGSREPPLRRCRDTAVDADPANETGRAANATPRRWPPSTGH